MLIASTLGLTYLHRSVQLVVGKSLLSVAFHPLCALPRLRPGYFHPRIGQGLERDEVMFQIKAFLDGVKGQPKVSLLSNVILDLMLRDKLPFGWLPATSHAQAPRRAFRRRKPAGAKLSEAMRRGPEKVMVAFKDRARVLRSRSRLRLRRGDAEKVGLTRCQKLIYYTYIYIYIYKHTHTHTLTYDLFWLQFEI